MIAIEYTAHHEVHYVRIKGRPFRFTRVVMLENLDEPLKVQVMAEVYDRSNYNGDRDGWVISHMWEGES